MHILKNKKRKTFASPHDCPPWTSTWHRTLTSGCERSAVCLCAWFAAAQVHHQNAAPSAKTCTFLEVKHFPTHQHVGLHLAGWHSGYRDDLTFCALERIQKIKKGSAFSIVSISFLSDACEIHKCSECWLMLNCYNGRSKWGS